MFSPYYAAARRRGDADPLDYCAVNVALYGPRSKHWALTERRKTSLLRSSHYISIGKSRMAWTGTGLTVDIAELAIPRFSPMRGTVRLYPEATTQFEVALDSGRRHIWRPLAPRARVDVQMEQPNISWRGSGYFDSNAGAAPLEDDFTSWTWSRADTGDGATILYDVARRRDDALSVAVRFDNAGRHEHFVPPPAAPLPRTGWRIARQSRSEDAGGPRLVRTLEDTPFYARSIVSTRLFGSPRIAMHESLSLERFRSRWVQTLLPFRMPRAFR